MNTIGVLDESRMARIPTKHWKAHEFCFFLHDSILKALIEYEQSGAHQWVHEAFQKVLSEHEVDDEIDIVSFLKENDLIDIYKHHLISHLVLGLISDMLNFLYEAMECFEKRKFSVAFALLRKPLKENLLFLCWIIANEDEFISNFEKETYKSLNNVKKDKQLDILAGAIAKIPNREAFEAALLWGHIYSKSNEAGFEHIWQRATHLITSQGDLLKTEDYSINFIFENAHSNHFYELLYARLPYLMMFLSQVSFECFNRVLKMNDHTYRHMQVVTMGCYEAIFSEKKRSAIISLLNRELKPFLNCMHCRSLMKINKGNAPAMYIRDQLVCSSCGLESAFPFYWIMSMANISLNESEN